MAITRQKKEEIVVQLRDIAQKAKTIVFVSFKKLNVNQQNEMRRSLQTEDIGYFVAKKTLMKKALGDLLKEAPDFPGEIALVYGVEELTAAQRLSVFVKKFPESLVFVGGILNGAYLDKERVTSIAAIPTMEVLRAQFVQLINSPLQRLAVVLDQIAEKQQ